MPQGRKDRYVAAHVVHRQWAQLTAAAFDFDVVLVLPPEESLPFADPEPEDSPGFEAPDSLAGEVPEEPDSDPGPFESDPEPLEPEPFEPEPPDSEEAPSFDDFVSRLSLR